MVLKFSWANLMSLYLVNHLLIGLASKHWFEIYDHGLTVCGVFISWMKKLLEKNGVQMKY